MSVLVRPEAGCLMGPANIFHKNEIMITDSLNQNGDVTVPPSSIQSPESNPSTPDTRHLDLSPPRRRRGEVARLPKEIRERINEMIDDGFPYKRIIEALGDHGKGLNEDIMHRWKTGGYQDYLNEQRL